MLDLARFVEEDEDDEEYISDLKRNQKRAEWAKGKTRASQPSENWDDDFLFGSASVESLPLPPKSSDLQPPAHKKPGSSQSINPALPSRSFHHQSHSSYSRPSKASSSALAPSTDPDPTILLNPDPDLNSLTPRKRPTQQSHPKNPSSPQALLASDSRLPPPRPVLARPPASAPPSRGQSVKSQSPNQTTVQRRVSPHHPPTVLSPTSPHHSSHSSISNRPWTPIQALSSQDSVPSISDFISSTGFRSPSSSLSMTDDGRWDWSHSSGDGSSARFRGAGSGNLSFNTETEFTEPDTELDWADTDHEHHSSRPIRPKPHSNQPTSRPQPFSSPFLNRPSSFAQPHHHRPPNPSPQLSESYDAAIQSEKCPTQRTSLENGDPHPCYTPAPLSFDSQATFTSSSQVSRSKMPAPSPSATSSTSSIGNFKPGRSNASSISSMTSYGNQYASRRSVQDLAPQQVRTPSSGSNFSNRFGFYNSGSESYDAAASGTETDVASDQFAGDESLQSISSPTSSANQHHTVCQRSRKQALYSRPPYVNPSPGRPLAASVSSSTLNASEIDLNPSLAELSLSDRATHRRAGEDEKPGKSQLRKRFRKKRPSTLLLNKAAANGIESPTSVISRRPSATDSVFTLDSAQPGDLAFAADSEDDTRRPKVLNQPTQKLNIARMNLHSRTPTRLQGLSSGARSPVTITRSHQILDRSRPGKTLPPPGTTSDESTTKKFQPRRPLSFTALFSRGSTSSHGSSLSHHTNSQNVVHQQPPKNRFSHRHSTSIDSNIQPLTTSSPHSQTSNDSLLSRVRRLSSRLPPAKNDLTSGLIRKRFSIVGDTVSGMPCLKATPAKSSATPTKPNKGISNRFSTASKSNRRQTSQSESVVSDMTLSAPDYQGTVRARRPSSRSSFFSSSNPDDVKPKLTLARKFSMRSNNKSSVHQPDLCHSPTDNIDHDLTSTTSVPAAPRPHSRKTLASRPPKSNPALRAKAEANAQMLDYHIHPDHSFHRKGYSHEAASDFDHVSSPVTFHHPFGRNSSNPVPISEPTPNHQVHEHDAQTANHLAHIGNTNATLTRSNSMGELRIPSRITSQQGRLQTELNQVKEFARGIEELKSMRLTYRKMIRSTHRSRTDQNFATTDESDANSTDSDHQKDPGPLLDREQSDETRLVRPNQVSPRALDRLYTIIQKIQEEYKEWWTCCNVLIDLGEGKTDPRARFSPERIRSITSYPEQPMMARPLSPILPAPVASPETEPSHKHFEILKSMFGPSVEPTRLVQDLEGDNSVVNPSQCTLVLEEKKPASCRTPPMESNPQAELCEKTPRSRPLVGAENPIHLPTTPSPAPRKASHHDRIPHNDSLSSVRLSDWSESESSWYGIEFSKDEIKSAPVKRHFDAPAEGNSEKEKSKPLAGHYSTYHHDRLVNFDSGITRPRLGAANRIGITGIKDFLRVLKARVNAEEKWPPRKKGVNNNASAMSVVGLKRRSVSSNLHMNIKGSSADQSQNEQEIERKSPSLGSLKEHKSGEHRDNMTESSSEEECWDELFGFKENNNTSSVMGTTESLDLALPVGQQHQTKKKINNAPSIGEGGRLALSSERMPQLLNYLSIVKEQCKECLVELKSQTV